MAAPDWNERCPGCQTKYKKYDAGYTYESIWQMYFAYTDDTSQWRYKRWRTVLGKWMELKREQWRSHKKTCCMCSAEPKDFVDVDTWKQHQRLCWRINYGREHHACDD